MCGIVGYVGSRDGSGIVIEGLKKLEYRGYDSWGVAVKNDTISVEKQIGKISDYDPAQVLPKGNIAIGHTRWATNGSVTQANAHPHTCCKGDIAVVHNGIIENFQELKKGLHKHSFSSETDTEIIAHLIEDNMEDGLSFKESFDKALAKLEGRFAVVAISKGDDEMLATRKGSPLVIGINEKEGKKEYFAASDIPAFLEHTNDVVFMEDGDVASITHDGITFRGESGAEVARVPERISWDVEQAELNGYDHYMLKEIIEQKATIDLAISQTDEKIRKVAKMIDDAHGTFFIGCGTAGKVGLVASYMFSKVAGKHVNAVVGSEFPNYHHFLTDRTLIVCISQSGETADTLEAIEVAKKKGCKVLSIVNVMGCTMMRMSDEYILCNSGPEKAVASTKVTTAQMSILALLAYACADRLEEGREVLKLGAMNVDNMLDHQYLDEVKYLAKKIAQYESMYLIGRSLNYPIALEGAIKMQEVPYIHAEGFAGGELKHGPIALIQSGTPCIAIVPNDEVKKEMLINALEIKSRGGYIIGIAPEDNEIFDFWLPVPEANLTSPIVNIIPIQLLSYYTALERNCDPDKPRNLAKSVTVK